MLLIHETVQWHSLKKNKKIRSKIVFACSLVLEYTQELIVIYKPKNPIFIVYYGYLVPKKVFLAMSCKKKLLLVEPFEWWNQLFWWKNHYHFQELEFLSPRIVNVFYPYQKPIFLFSIKGIPLPLDIPTPTPAQAALVRDTKKRNRQNTRGGATTW